MIKRVTFTLEQMKELRLEFYKCPGRMKDGTSEFSKQDSTVSSLDSRDFRPLILVY